MGRSGPANPALPAPTPYVYPDITGEHFAFGVVGLEHGHVYTMCAGLLEAGALLTRAYDPDATKLAAFVARFPGVKAARCEAEILEDPAIALVVGCTIPCERAGLGRRAMAAGKDYFCDKAAFTILDQLDAARAACASTGRRFFVYYSERLHVACAEYAAQLIAAGSIGRIVNIIATGPHRLDPAGRPDWFFDLEKTGGILCDIGSHQVEQFLFFADAQDATITFSRAGNVHHPDYPGLEDLGEVSLLADNGCSGYFRVDWFSPAALSGWGDGRLLLLGTEGYIELRKNTDIAQDPTPNHLFLVNQTGEHHVRGADGMAYPFFGRLIQDCLHRTETAMTQAHIFKASELSLLAARDRVPYG